MFAVWGLWCKVRGVGSDFTIKGLRLKVYGFPTKFISVEVLTNIFLGNIFLTQIHHNYFYDPTVKHSKSN